MVYPGQVPLETDLLNTNKFAMLGLAKLAAALLGAGPLLYNLPCTPGTGLHVIVGAGQIYAMAAADASAYSSLAADSHQILKQGLLLDPVTLACPAPATAGQSINYLVQVGFQEADTGTATLQFFNSANPLQPYSGPNGTGSASTTVRSAQCVVSIKAGAAATTGLQVTPATDSGFIAAYVVTVANGAVSIASGNIAVAANAPFLANLTASHHGGVPGQAPKIHLDSEVQGILPLTNLPPSLAALGGGGSPTLDKGNSGTTAQVVNYGDGEGQTITATGNHSLSTTGWPANRIAGVLLRMDNYGGFTLTTTGITWIKADKTLTTDFNSSGIALPTSGSAFVVLFSYGDGIVYGKAV